MHAADWVIACATLLGPVLGIQIQKYLDKRGERNRRQVEVYRTLMMNRMTSNSPPFVNALNAVPLEFHDNDAVMNSWRDLLMHLNTDAQAQPEVWGQRRITLLIELLKAMGTSLHYGFRDAELQAHAYLPNWQVSLMNDQELLRKGIVDLIKGEATIPMSIDKFPTDPEMMKRTAEVQTLLIEWLEGKRSPPLAIQPEKVQQ
ncbi:DUF6680 family protein [Burkholderia cenocepacia]|uniref:DUF6680 family protein n=1 Tax=Burkholderia cenocepacia TaxID=95486 RepID=UPI0006AC0E7E|nr:DUF6680 family protein [Burkholderia cenocepacia]KOR22784.1 hypothetical protein ABW54_04795 [Burkholderia cenocepacia]